MLRHGCWFDQDRSQDSLWCPWYFWQSLLSEFVLGNNAKCPSLTPRTFTLVFIILELHSIYPSLFDLAFFPGPDLLLKDIPALINHLFFPNFYLIFYLCWLLVSLFVWFICLKPTQQVLQSRNILRSNKMLGSFKLDVATVWAQPGTVSIVVYTRIGLIHNL